MSTIIFNAKVRLENGTYASGPVTTENNVEYLFRNRSSDLDLYFSVEKKVNWVWTVVFGPSFEIPTTLVTQLGNQIDYYNADKGAIELLADGFLHLHLPNDQSVKEIHFDFITDPSLNVRVFYSKQQNTEGSDIWKFNHSELLPIY